MVGLYFRLIGSALRMGAAVVLLGLGLVAIRLTSELGMVLGGAVFDALAPHLAMASDTRGIFEGIAAVSALVASSAAVGWLCYRLFRFRRRERSRFVRQGQPASAQPM